MSKRNANNAIDFKRLFNHKDRLATDLRSVEKPAEPVSLQAEPAKNVVGAPDDSAIWPREELTAVQGVTVLDFRSPTLAEAVERAAVLPIPAAEPTPAAKTEKVDTTSATDAFDAPACLRVGMPRSLHERVRAAAALACVAPRAFVQNLLETSTPHFDRTAPLSVLGKVARDAIPATGAGRPVAEVRMQVPVPEDLHQRLVQMAALRGQTLAVSLLEVLEHRVPNE